TTTKEDRMLLTPTEMERLVIFTAAELARKRRGRGVKLNHPEAVAFIADEILEGARDGRSVADLISFGATLLTTDDVLPGVMDLMPMIQVEATFPDGTKLVTVHDPIRPGKRPYRLEPTPGDLTVPAEEFEINAGRREITLKVLNTGDRPVQVGSHYHFFETNPALDFDRSAAFGMRLAVPAGTAVRFEPGESKEVTLCEFGGTGELGGLNSLTDGSRHAPEIKEQALRRARERGFRGACKKLGNRHRRDYAAMYGPTTGDAVRLGDTSLLAEIEHDHAVKGDECLHGGGKTLRDGMGLAAGHDSAAGALDMLLSNAVLIDPV